MSVITENFDVIGRIGNPFAFTEMIIAEILCNLAQPCVFRSFFLKVRLGSHRFKKGTLCDFFRKSRVFYDIHHKRVYLHKIGMVYFFGIHGHSPPSRFHKLDGEISDSLQIFSVFIISKKNSGSLSRTSQVLGSITQIVMT